MAGQLAPAALAAVLVLALVGRASPPDGAASDGAVRPASATTPRPGADGRHRVHCLRLAGAAWQRMKAEAERPLDARDTRRLVNGLPPACRRVVEER